MNGPLRLANATIAVEVAPERGAEIRFVGPPDGPNLLYFNDTASPLRASRSTTYGSPELDWLSEYRGGWQELFPNAGAACVVDGVPLAFHGDASTARWEVLDTGSRHAVLTTAARLPLVLERRMRLHDREPVLVIDETVRNDAEVDAAFLWGHHPAFDARPGALVDLPGAGIQVPSDYDPPHNDLLPGGAGRWPHAPARAGPDVDLRQVPRGPRERVVYLTDVEAGWAALRQPDTGLGAALSWDRQTFPHLWMWTEIGGDAFPWYGRSRIVALEPNVSWPSDGLAAAMQRGQAHRAPAGSERSTRLCLALFAADERPVRGVFPDGAVLR